jgi:quercetin dioxygenase-like cupin family protein
MQITRSSIETQKGPATCFTGDVHIDAIAATAGTSTFAAAAVHFTPGARTAWHTHPHGQTIFVTEGAGLCRREGGDVEVIRPGDRVFFEAGENHWHGATPDRFMVHIAMQRRQRQPCDLGRARDRRPIREVTHIMILEETYTLSNGVEIPKLGLGTWLINNRNAASAVTEAVKFGYRHLHTAQAYSNEEGIGEGIRTSGWFSTTRSPTQPGAQAATKSCTT